MNEMSASEPIVENPQRRKVIIAGMAGAVFACGGCGIGADLFRKRLDNRSKSDARTLFEQLQVESGTYRLSDTESDALLAKNDKTSRYPGSVIGQLVELTTRRKADFYPVFINGALYPISMRQEDSSDLRSEHDSGAYFSCKTIYWSSGDRTGFMVVPEISLSLSQPETIRKSIRFIDQEGKIAETSSDEQEKILSEQVTNLLFSSGARHELLHMESALNGAIDASQKIGHSLELEPRVRREDVSIANGEKVLSQIENGSVAVQPKALLLEADNQDRAFEERTQIERALSQIQLQYLKDCLDPSHPQSFSDEPRAYLFEFFETLRLFKDADLQLDLRPNLTIRQKLALTSQGLQGLPTEYIRVTDPETGKSVLAPVPFGFKRANHFFYQMANECNYDWAEFQKKYSHFSDLPHWNEYAKAVTDYYKKNVSVRIF